jgi:oligoribonuclease NrnB/cAMP/cGMP phosphodiesterase (DHH superfamily)
VNNLPPANSMTDVWYHANCADGFGAAWSAWKVLGDEANYEPVRHGDPKPEVNSSMRLAIVDFAYPRDELLDIAEKVDTLIVLDHHRSAAKDLDGLEFARFDLNKSGARMAWEYWHPNDELPELLAFVEDRDLWRWELRESREVNLAITQTIFAFDKWENFDVETLKAEGSVLLGYQQSIIARSLSKHYMTELAGYQIPAVNSFVFQSDIGDELCKMYPDAPFAAVWCQKTADLQAWSLRSIGEFDVSVVAEKFGGGGHRNAAGFGRTD